MKNCTGAGSLSALRPIFGAVAQLGARLTGSQEVEGSNPFSSTIRRAGKAFYRELSPLVYPERRRGVYPERSRGAHGRPPAALNGDSGTNNPGFSGLFYCQAIGPFDQSLPLDTLQPARHTEALSTGVHDGTGIGRAALSPPTAQPTAHHKPRRPLARSAAPEGVLLFQRRIPV